MGEGVAYAVLGDGGVWSWGQNDGGQLGADSPAALSRVPVQVPGLTGVTDLLVGRTVYVLRTDGSVWGWGDNGSYALASGAASPVVKPIRIPVPATVVDLDHRRALDGDGRVWTWGYNGSGDLGIGHSWDVGASIEQARVPRVTKLLAGHAVVPTP
jgi:alpha-tubulin suppressor-like RCC1 family protein